MNETKIWVVVGIVVGSLSALVLKLTLPMSKELSLLAGPAFLLAGAGMGRLIARGRG